MYAKQLKPKVDIIWNITRLCMWNCSMCCVDAVHVQKQKAKIVFRSHSLKRETSIDFSFDGSPMFDQASQHQVRSKAELSYEDKLRVLRNLESFDPTIDFSGGDPFISRDTGKIIRIASEKFGRERVTLTATGAGLKREHPTDIAPFIGELNFTYDSTQTNKNVHRPHGYVFGNLRMAAKYVKMGVKTRAETPLSSKNISDKILQEIYRDLHEHGIQTHLIMRLFPVGRGTFFNSDIPSYDEYRRSIDVLRGLEAKLGTPKVKLQCALKYLDPDFESKENPCDAVSGSFGLMWDGTLLGSP